MLQVNATRWVLGELGIFDLPKNVQRDTITASWRVTNSKGSFWEYTDSQYGNHYYSLKEAVRMAITIASLPYQSACEYMQLINKNRLHETGVTGVYYRSGLKETYVVIYNGSQVKVPYDKGKGFTKALRLLEELLDPSVEALRQQFKQTTL